MNADKWDSMSKKQRISGLKKSSMLEPVWIVNSASELGVMVQGVCYFLYKAGNLVYNGDEGIEVNMIRPLFKREFGECCIPFDPDTFGKNGPVMHKFVSTDDCDWWVNMPKKPKDFKESHKRGPEFFLKDIKSMYI